MRVWRAVRLADQRDTGRIQFRHRLSDMQDRATKAIH
jgi:hypothetical protein